MIGDLFGVAGRRLAQESARAGSTGVVISYRYVPWPLTLIIVDWVYLTDEWFTGHPFLDGVSIGMVAGDRYWKPIFVEAEPGRHCMSSFEFDARLRGNPDLLASVEFEVRAHEVVVVRVVPGYFWRRQGRASVSFRAENPIARSAR